MKLALAASSALLSSLGISLLATGPQISSIQANGKYESATVTWNTDVASDSTVQYDPANCPPLPSAPSVHSSALVTKHSVALSGLQPANTYCFNLASCDASKNCTTENGAGSFFTLSVPGSWERENSPNVTSKVPGLLVASHLLATAVISANDVWAVGWATNPKGPQYSEITLIEHWDGTSWRIVPSPNPAFDVSELHSISAVSSTDIWAVGITENVSSLPSMTLIEHWDGSKWTIVPSPNPGIGANELLGVTAISAENAWAVGLYANYTLSTPGKAKTLHWDGKQWTQVPSPSPNSLNFNNELFAVSAIAGSATDIWAVGFTGNNGQFVKPLTVHWNGRSWSVFSAPNVSNSSGSYFVAVSGVASDDVWAVGQTDSEVITSTSLLSEHWDGTKWTPANKYHALTVSASNYTAFYSVCTVAHDFIWAVGENMGAPLIYQWNGTIWSQVPAASFGSSNANRLWAVGALDTGNAWAVGDFGFDVQTFKTAAEEYSVP